MKKKTFLTPEESYRLVVRAKEGATYEELMQEFKICRRTLDNKLAIYDDSQQFLPIKRKKTTKVDPEVIKEVQNYIENVDNYASREELIAKFNLPITKQCLTRYLKMNELHGRVAANKILIEPDNQEKRVSICSQLRSRTVEEWKKFVFIDESGADNSSRKRRYQWRKKGTRRTDKENICQTPNSSLRLNFFSWVSVHGTGELFFYDRMNGALFMEIVPTMIEKLKQTFGHENFKVIMDNAAFHKSKFVREELEKSNLKKFFALLPAYSPDMNIIENLWGIMKNRVRDHQFINGQVREKEQFMDLIELYWKSIEPEIIRNLYESLPRRMVGIVSANGELIKY